MTSGPVTNRYTEGLFRYASSQGAVDAVDTSLKAMADLIADHPQLQTVINHPLIAAEAKLKAVTAVMGDTLDPLVARFLRLLFERGRGAYVSAIYARFHQLAEAARGEASVDVTSAMALSDEQLTGIEQQLGRALGKRVHASLTIDPDLIAGCRIRVDDRVIDASIRGALAQFTQKLAGGAVKEGTL